MIVVTGTNGFIASRLVQKLNQLGKKDIILVDDEQAKHQKQAVNKLDFQEFIDRNKLIDWLPQQNDIEFIFHLGARTDTTEQDQNIFNELNLNFSKAIFSYCSQQNIPIIYASSAATYGDGSQGYDDELDSHLLSALNPYGESKLQFDLWVNQQKKQPPFWAGLKFFNVYGPNENHKGRMASVVFHAYKQIKQTGKMRLFQSHRDNYADGEQKRDFIYVDDVVDICLYFYQNQQKSGIYNVGTGEAKTFNDLVKAVFSALNLPPQIEYIPTPVDIRDAYQYYTQATTVKLRNAGYKKAFTKLNEGVRDYVINYLER